jgi:hypothetical protein
VLLSFVLHRLKIARRPATRRPLLRYNPGMTKHRWCIAASRAVLLAASIQFACTEPLDTQKLVLENQFVRVFEIRVPPGVFEPRHSHARGVTIALSDYSNEVTNYPDGKVAHGQVKFGDVRWAEPVTHEARNTGTTEQHVIRIELKQPAPAGSSAPPADLDSLLVVINFAARRDVMNRREFFHLASGSVALAAFQDNAIEKAQAAAQSVEWPQT